MDAELMGGGFSQRQSALEVRLRSFSDPQARLAWVVDRAARRPAESDGLRQAANEVKGCASRLWLHARLVEGRCRFRSDSESAILKAFVSLLCELYEGLDPAEVLHHEPVFLASTGLDGQLTESRRRTLLRVRQAIRDFAAGSATAPGVMTPTLDTGHEAVRRP